MQICVSKLTIIGSNNGLSPGRRQAIIWTNAGILLIGPSGTNFSEILIETDTFSFKKMHLKMLSVKYKPFCLSLNVLTGSICPKHQLSLPNCDFNYCCRDQTPFSELTDMILQNFCTLKLNTAKLSINWKFNSLSPVRNGSNLKRVICNIF